MNPIGWREYECAPQAASATLDALRELAVSLLSDNMARASGAVGLLPYHRPKPLAGSALTIRTRPGDNLAIHRAFELCRPGDVLVIDGAGDLTQALMGEIMATFAESLGVRGLVIDGAIRDVGALRQRDFPVYARGVTHRGPYKNGPGEINVPVTVGGMIVHPGDIIVGDEDGMLAIAPADVDAVIEGARRQQAKEAAALASIADGSFDRAWVAPQRDRMMNT
ncbi:RraA family protein [Paraburkholderia ginsengisoli]|uniref:Putative 4-hydroxy-4-methyl-2-oxoglutarate aldolase n=1 Tax=Paraburkholderia ginsengisoli TaxID=311231 RepID=A0A7T4N869_9BURK|nr:RraA family protein [Paraburkholderia ginsengisoli]QQC67018.1 RraA family protein [Paraburkholderia ginsengisoli]